MEKLKCSFPQNWDQLFKMVKIFPALTCKEHLEEARFNAIFLATN